MWPLDNQAILEPVPDRSVASMSPKLRFGGGSGKLVLTLREVGGSGDGCQGKARCSASYIVEMFRKHLAFGNCEM